ncbi:MAG: Protease HtpX [Phycisphaerae bacterium]|nr:Protease HtpX [Phycisphaerae bacterium]
MVKFVNNMKTAALLAGLTALCMAVGSIWGPTGVLIGLAIGLASNGIAWFASDKIALASMRAVQVTERDDPELVGLVHQLADRAGIPRPRVYVSPHQAPNAFATGRNPSHGVVCVTAGLLHAMTRDELAGVLAHELGHIKHRDILISTVAATIASAITTLAWMAMWFGDDERNPLAGLLMFLLAPLAAGLIQMAISRSREYAADAEGAAIAGSPHGLASALAKLDGLNKRIPMRVNPSRENMFIVAPLTGRSMANLFSTHPPTEQRIAKLLGR